MPYDNYRLYQIERTKSPAEVRRADEQAARLASAASSLFRCITRPWQARRRPSRTATRDLPRPAPRAAPHRRRTQAEPGQNPQAVRD